MAVLRYLAKLKRGMGLAFGAHFVHDFPEKCSLFNSLSMDKVSMSHLISFSRYQTKCVIKFLFGQLMTSQILRFFLDQPLKQWLTWEKRGKTKIQKFKYLMNKNSFLDEIKNIFHSF